MKSVLVVEDRPVLRAGIDGCCKRYWNVEAATGEVDLIRVDERDFDLIIVDLNRLALEG